MTRSLIVGALALTLAASPAFAGSSGSMGGHSSGGSHSGSGGSHMHGSSGMGSHGMNAGSSGGAGGAGGAGGTGIGTGTGTGIGYGGSGTGIGGGATLNGQVSGTNTGTFTSTFNGRQSLSSSNKLSATGGNSSVGNVGGGTATASGNGGKSSVRVNASPTINVWAQAPSGGFLSGDSGLIVGGVAGFVAGEAMSNHGPSCPPGSTVGYMGDCQSPQPQPQAYPVYLRGKTRVIREPVCMEAGTHWSQKLHECTLNGQRGSIPSSHKVAQAN